MNQIRLSSDLQTGKVRLSVWSALYIQFGPIIYNYILSLIGGTYSARNRKLGICVRTSQEYILGLLRATCPLVNWMGADGGEYE